MKKILTSILMAIIVVFGCVMFTACGGGEPGKVVYEAYHAQLEEMKKEDSPFGAATRNNITSNFMMKNFMIKTASETKLDYGDQDELIALGLNFIEKYYPLAKDFEKGSDIAHIKSSLEKMSEGYEILKEEYSNTKKISDSEDMTIYNGFIARYAEAARHFSSTVYDCAAALARYLSNTVKVDESIESEAPTAAAIEFYVERNILKVYHDYNEFLMNNCKASVGSMNSGWYSLSGKSVKTNLSKEATAQAVAYFTALDGERILTREALENFSYYDYQIIYNGDVKAYEKIDSHVGIYLKQIEKYFNQYLITLNAFCQTTLYQ